MNNKCRIKMVQEGYITWKTLHGKRDGKNCKQICNRALSKKYLRINILGPIREHYSLTSFCYLSLFSIRICFSVTWFMWAQFPNPLSTNLLFLAILGLSPYIRGARSLKLVYIDNIYHLINIIFLFVRIYFLN